MSTNKYQPWEDEMEAPELEENGVSSVSLVVSATLGLLLFCVLVVRTSIASLFKISPAMESSEPRKNTKARELQISANA